MHDAAARIIVPYYFIVTMSTITIVALINIIVVSLVIIVLVGSWYDEHTGGWA